MRRVPIRESFVFFAFVVLSIVMTWPLLPNSAHSVTDVGFNDHLLATRVLRLIVDWFIGNRSGLLDADYFFPHPNVFGTTDPGIGIGLMVLPFRLFTDDYLLLQNFALLLSFPLTAHATYLLARELTGSRRAAFLAGTAFAFCLYRFHQLDHTGILQMQWLPYTLVCLHRLRDRQTVRNGIWLTICLVGGGLWSPSLTLYSIPVLFLSALWAVVTAAREKRLLLLGTVIISAVAAILFFVPMVLAHLNARDAYGMVRETDDIKFFSARIEQFLAAPPYNGLYGAAFGKLLGLESATFLGVTVIVLSAFAVIDPLRRRSRSAPSPASPSFIRSPTALYLVVALLYAVLSLGPDVRLFEERVATGLWSALSWMPGFSSVRTPARFFFVTSLAAAVLAACGLARLLSHAMSRRTQTLVFVLALSATLAESFSAPLPLRRYPTRAEAPPVYHWLATQPGKGAIAELPMDGRPARHRMYFANIHKRPTVDGTGSFYLPAFGWLSPESVENRAAVLHLERLGIAGLKFVLLHRDEVPPPHIPRYLRTLDRVGARHVESFGSTDVYEMPVFTQPVKPLSRTSARAFFQVPPALFRGEPLKVSVHFFPDANVAIFEPGARRFDLGFSIASRPAHVDKSARVVLSPPLIAPASVETASVEIPLTLAPGAYPVSMRLTDDVGEVWIDQKTDLRVAEGVGSGSDWPGIDEGLGSSAATPTTCAFMQSHSYRGAAGSRRTLMIVTNTGIAPWIGAIQPELRIAEIASDGTSVKSRSAKLPAISPGSSAPVAVNVSAETTTLNLEVRFPGVPSPACTRSVRIP